MHYILNLNDPETLDDEIASIPTAEQVAAFLSVVSRPNVIMEIRIILKDGDKVKQVVKRWCTSSELLTMLPELHHWNSKGFNIYVGANARRKRGESGDEAVISAQSVFVDSDPANGFTSINAFLERIEQAGLPAPTAVISSGHGGWAFWTLAEPLLDLDEFRAVQNRLAMLLGTDTAVCNPERLVRLPGFWNWKPPKSYAWLHTVDTTRIYPLAAITEYLPELPRTKQTTIPRLSITTSSNSYADLLRRARRYLATVLPADIKNRNTTIYKAAGHLWALVGNCGETLDEADIIALMRGFNLLNNPPLEDDELVQAVRNSAKYKPREPKPPIPNAQFRINRGLALRGREVCNVD